MVCRSWAHTKVRCNMLGATLNEGPVYDARRRKDQECVANSTTGCLGVHQSSSGRTKRTQRLQARLVLGKAHGEPPDRAVFKIMEAPVVSVEGRNIQSIVFLDSGSNVNFIT